MNIDGVQESKSTIISLDTYSIAFNGCRSIYPIKVIRAVNKFKIDDQAEIKRVLDDINENNILLDSAIFDNPKRSTATCTMCAGATYACEYCVSAAILYSDEITDEKIKTIKRKYTIQKNALERQIQTLIEAPGSTSNEDARDQNIQFLQNGLEDLKKQEEEELNRKKRKRLTWPYETINGELRTIESITEIANLIVESGPLDKHTAKGITGKSHFLYQPNFNLLTDAPCEYMHLVCLGVVKRLLELTFKVGENRERVTKRKLSDPQAFNSSIAGTQSPREFGRRCRNLDFSVLKAQEFRNILLFFFPLVIDTIEDNHKNEIKIWLFLVYMIRSCIVTNEEFLNIEKDVVNDCCHKFYKLFQKEYGQNNCTYSIHVASSHLLKIRGNQPFTSKSAFKFESFFAEMRHMFVPGTPSTVKQILSNCYMKKSVEYHSCEKTVHYSPQKKKIQGKPFHPGLENNSLIYVLDDNHSHQMYEIIETDETNNSFLCATQGKFKYTHSLTPRLDWSKVGVYKVGPTCDEQLRTIEKHEICGKVVKVKNLLITCPLNVLHEK